MGDLQKTGSSVTDVIKTGQNNQQGLIGVISLVAMAIGGLAIKALSGK